jgi:integrase
MARTIHRLTATQLTRLKRPGLYSDGGNLKFKVAGNSRCWVCRFAVNGKTRDAGLGPYPEVSLADARAKAFEWRRLLVEGVDPLEQRNTQRAAARVEGAKSIIFDDCARAYIAAHDPGWRNRKHAKQWTDTLAAYVSPVFGKLPVSAIDTGLVMRALEPIWKQKPETATRVRGRIEAVLDWARVRGYREGENPARWRGHLDHLLPARSKVQRVEHHPALPYGETGAFMLALRHHQPGVNARALEFTILTAARAGEVLGATWNEIDFATKTWTIPASRMKGGREHRVPLSARASAILDEMYAVRHSDFIFPGRNAGNPLGAASFVQLLRRMGRADITVHGFRSTFRDWAGERTSFPKELAELSLAHNVGSDVERLCPLGPIREAAQAHGKLGGLLR